MIPVSVVVITKDEEGNIEDALRSASGFQEIIIVDSFSTDRTVEICGKYTDRIYRHEWPGYARQKQRAVDYAAGPWVLILDADERITPELKQEIAEAVSPDSSRPGAEGPDGFMIPRRNYFLGKWIRHSGWWPDATLRLFRKDRGRFEDREVHEKVMVQGTVGSLRSPFEHHTYRTISDFTRKMDSYSLLAAREIRKRSGRPGITTIILRPFFTFFRMYFLRLGFLDGMRGLLLGILYGYYTFLKYARAWELE